MTDPTVTRPWEIPTWELGARATVGSILENDNGPFQAALTIAYRGLGADLQAYGLVIANVSLDGYTALTITPIEAL